MSDNKTKKAKLRDKARGSKSLERARRFSNARVARLLSDSKTTSKTVDELIRSRRFSRKIAGKHDQFAIANTLQFLNFISGDKFMAAESPGMRGSWVFKGPDTTVHQSFERWFVESVLSLTVNNLQQYFGVWLNQACTAEMLLSIENKIDFFTATRTRSSVQNTVYNQSAAKRAAPTATHKVLRIVERIFSAVCDKHFGARHWNDVYHSTSFRAIESFLPVYAMIRADEIGRKFGISVPKALPPSLSTFMLPRQNASVQSSGVRRKIEEVFFTRRLTGFDQLTRNASSRPQQNVESQRARSLNQLEPSRAGKTPDGSGHRPLVDRSIGSEHRRLVDRPNVSRQPAALAKIESRFRQQQETNLFFAKTFTNIATSVSSDLRWPVALTKIENWFQRQREANFFFTKTFTKIETSSAGSEDIVLPEIGRNKEFTENEFTFPRRAGQMSPPSQTFAYVQPMRRVIEEEQVIKRVQEKEVVQIVKNQVETALSSRSPVTELSRADYTRITSQVYSSLARRLMMEKERLGHRNGGR
jgi:hypothetical protein